MKKLLTLALLLLAASTPAQILPGILSAKSASISYATVSFIDNTGGGYANGSPATANFGTAPNTSGDILVCSAEVQDAAATITMSDNLTDVGSAWTAAIGPYTDYLSLRRLYIFYRTLGSTANSNTAITATQSGGTPTQVYVSCGQFHKTAGAWHVDPASGVSASASTFPATLSNLTTSSSSALIFVFFSGVDETAAASGYTKFARNGSGSYVRNSFYTITGAGSKDPNQTVIAVPIQWAAVAVGFSAY